MAYETWALAYPATQAQRNKELRITFNSVGSGSGRAFLISAGNTSIASGRWITDAGASDARLPAAEVARGDLRTIPMLVGSLCLIYYIPGFTQELELTREMAVGIFNGTIRWWNDTLLVSRNPELASIPQRITLVVRGDSSGSTEILTSGLSAFSSEWLRVLGIFSASTWSRSNATRVLASGSEALTRRVLKTAYTIGYAELAAALDFKVPYARMINKAGNKVDASLPNLNAAIEDFKSALASANRSNFFSDLSDGAGPNTYPFAAFTYMVVRLGHPLPCERMYEVVRYLYWGLKDEQASNHAADAYFQAMKGEAANIGEAILNQMTCGGRTVLDKVKEDIIAEQFDWRQVYFQWTLLGKLC